MNQANKTYIIGIGDDGLEAVPSSVRKKIEDADIVFGAEKTLALVPNGKAEKRALGADLGELVKELDAARSKKAVLLVYGDPMFYGLARYVYDKLGKDRFEVVPHVSSMQLAFARVMESWDEAYLTDLSNHPLESVLEKIRTAQKVGLFTSAGVGPAEVAQQLLDRHIDYFTAYVCENLGARNERVTRGTLQDIAGGKFDMLNVMILVRQADAPDRPREAVGRRLIGNPDEAFLQSKPKYGLLTPAEVRAIALAQMDIAPSSIIWDVGAGSGSISVEAAQLANQGTVYAIEMDAEDHGLIKGNAERFGVSNVVAVLGKAPEAWDELPDPDAVFIAGSGREITRIADLAYGRLRAGGRLVVNVVSVENVSELRYSLGKHSRDVHVWMINVARGTDQLGRLSFDALKPSFLLAVVKSS